MRYLARWFSRYQVLGFTAFFALVVIGFEGVAGLGLPALFWCREWYGLLFIGFVVANFFALCSFIGFLLDHEKLELPADRTGLRQYFLRTIWLPSLIVIARGIYRNFQEGVSCGMEWVMVAGYIAGALFVWFGAPQLNRLSSILAKRPWFVKLMKKLARRNPEEEFDPWLHAYAFVTALLLWLIYLGFSIWPDPVNAAVAITILLGLVVLTYGALRFFIPRWMLLVVLGLVLWVAAANQLPRKHQYDELKDSAIVDLGKPPAGADLLSDQIALQGWRAYLGKHCKEAKPKLIVLMTSGGGVRASVWTAAVLRELDRRRPCGYLQHVRVIGGASGGMVGAGYWVTQRMFADPKSYGEDLRGVTADALDSVARYLALRDVPALFIPARIRDRGFALEEAWKKNAPGMARPFKELRTYEESGVSPSLIYTPASLDDGRRVLVSNLDLDYMTRHAIDGHDPTRSAFQFFERFGTDKLTVATAARMSASFPYVSSAAELPTTKLRRLGDAGYFDNYGGFVISSWLAQNRQWLVDNTSGVLVIQVRDSPVGAGNRAIDAGPSNNRFARAFSELTAPIQGVASTRTKAMHFRTDFELATVAPLFGKGFVEQVEIELPNGLAPLSWNLTERAAKAIIDHAPKEVTVKMRTIEAWWKAPPAARPATRIPPTSENQSATTPTAAGRTRASSSPL